MWTVLKANYRIILTSIGFLILGFALSFLFENHYRQFVRFSFKFFNGDKIQFVGKNFHLFVSNRFLVSFGLFSSLAFLLIRTSLKRRRIIKTLLMFIVLLISTLIVTALDSKRLIIECTNCDDGIRKLTYNEITYDTYFIICLIIAILFLLIQRILESNKSDKKMKRPSLS